MHMQNKWQNKMHKLTQQAACDNTMGDKTSEFKRVEEMPKLFKRQVI